MDFHDKEFFDKLMAMTEENNTLLKKMWRAVKIGRVVQFSYWFIIIGLSIGAFYFVQPYIDRLLSVYTDLGLGGGGTGTFSELLKTYSQ